MRCLMLLPVMIPVLIGLWLLIMKDNQNRKKILIITSVGMVITDLLAVIVMIVFKGEYVILYQLTRTLPLLFKIDEMGIIFAVVSMIVMTCAGFFSFTYMEHEEHEKRYYGYYLIVFGVFQGLCYSGNLVTFYMFFELMTLTSVPLVLHNQSHEAIMAGLKYLFYSLAGAYAALFGLFFLYHYGNTLTFSAGGVLDHNLLVNQNSLLLVVAFIMIMGFSVKAGMFPMHAWLPTAHPVAPAPASAVLSAVIVKGGVLAIIRVIYYLFGVEFLAGTWVQQVFLILTLITVFMGSLLAYREPVLKKRLAYSTVSQLSYILFGLGIMNQTAFTGGVLHVIAHAFIKAVLFLSAGAIICKTGKTRVDELKGIGKQMPVVMWCYTIVSLGLIGIPPTGGFISKWYLATGALQSQIPVISILGPVILLVSALLTAGYLLPISIKAFLPGVDFDYANMKKIKAGPFIVISLLILTVLSVVLGVFPNSITEYINQAAMAVMP